MARRKRGNPVNGWIILDKPPGMTSAHAVSATRRIFDAQKAGHAGTLDPLATGILPIAIGEATKTVPYVMDASKEYTFEVTWGEERTTDDLEGTVSGRSDVRPDIAAIEAALPRFQGVIKQVPPIFSAVKIKGRRAYDLARKEEPVALSSREVRVDFFELVEARDADHALFRVGSGKGAYMRSLARDLARAAGTLGHISMLRRHRVGPFLEADSISLDSLKALEHSAAAFEHLLPVETALDGIPALTLAGAEANKLRCGQSVPVFRALNLDRFGDLREGDVIYAVSGGSPVMVGRIDGGCICPMRVLNL